MTIAADLPANEAERLKELEGYFILDTLPEEAYDDIAYLASEICGCPIALMSLVDGDRQWFKAKVGLDAEQTSRDTAFCAHAILNPNELMVVPDAMADHRFATNPLVTSDPSIRFYAGAPLTTSSGNALGALCVIDNKPRELDEKQRSALLALSRQVIAQLELRRTVASLKQHAKDRSDYQARLEKYQRELELSNELLAEQSRTDALTGLNNRRAFFDHLGLEITRAERHDQPLSLAIADIDRFKSFNDSFGHPDGDEALKAVAVGLEHESRASDFVARYGGEEFTILLSNTGLDGATILAERFRLAVEEAVWDRRPVTVSLGVAAWESGMSGDDLIAAADRALYRAKKAGRNQIAVPRSNS